MSERILSNTYASERQSLSMDFLLKNFNLNPPKAGDLSEGKFIEQRGAAVFIDLGPYGTGIIYGREYINARDAVRKLKPGDAVTAKVVATENENGYIELSLKEAGQEIVWQEAEEMQAEGTNLTLPVIDANKGGLIMEWKGIKGFLPASQLRLKHYPRVEGGDKNKILDELKKLIGAELVVTIIASDHQEEKLIFSEKGTEADELKEIIGKYKIGDIIQCEVTGVVDFGTFVKIEDGLEGLIHISELDWSLVENPADIYKIGDKVNAQIIEIKDGKISLSIKNLKPNPWTETQQKYKKGDVVKGNVLKFNRHGSLISIENGIAGLVHISEFGSEKEMKEKLEIGKQYFFQIVIFEPQDHRLILTFLDENKKEEREEKKETQE